MPATARFLGPNRVISRAEIPAPDSTPTASVVGRKPSPVWIAV